MNTIAINLEKVRELIIAACAQYHRPAHAVQLLAVTKSKPVAAIRAAAAAGQTRFGENYLQEALFKIEACQDLSLEWHFIGSIQANKTRKIATHFSWVHGLCDEKIATRLNAQRPLSLPPLNVCIEVNVSHEPSKSGISIADLPEFATMVAAMPQLALRGLMTIPARNQDFASQRQPYRTLRIAKQELLQQGFELDTLSMGMSHDFTAAIAEGATIVRVGQAIFGAREI